ncbi:MAG: helix-turn-helix transcriptional regulator [Clostridiales bacterium]|nr:helix-turn-helix transcriptional regulator [Clostridiales bacterium]
MENRNIEVGLRIRKARNDKGLTQKALAEAIGRTESLIAQYERGKVEIPLSGLEKLAKALEIDTSELLYGKVTAEELVILRRERFEKGLGNMANQLFQWAKDARLSKLVEGYDSLNLSAQLQFSEIANKFNLLNDEGRTLLLADAEKYLSSSALRNVEDASAQPTEETPTDT